MFYRITYLFLMYQSYYNLVYLTSTKNNKKKVTEKTINAWSPSKFDYKNVNVNEKSLEISYVQGIFHLNLCASLNRLPRSNDNLNFKIVHKKRFLAFQCI